MTPGKTGFVVGAIGPVALGLFVIARDIASRQSLSEVENQVYCGTGMLAAWMMILFVSPLCGTIGAVIGILGSKLFGKSRNSEAPPVG